MKKFTYTTLTSLLSEVKTFLPSMEQYIDEGKIIGKVLWCNDKLGMPIREMKETLIKIRNYGGELPVYFQKVIYVAALKHSSFGIAQYTDPFDNFKVADEDECTVEYVERCTNKNRKITLRDKTRIITNYTNWTELSLSPASYIHSTSNCINRKIDGKFIIDIDEGNISLPFREGELYLMYYANLVNENNEVLIPFDALIFPWYKYSIIEDVLMSMAFNSDQDVGQKLQLAKKERQLAWLDAYSYTISRTYQEAIKFQREKEIEFYKRYFTGY